VVVPFFRVQEVAFVELHESTEDCPRVRVPGFADRETVEAVETQLSPVTSYPDEQPHVDALSTKVPLLQYFGLVMEHSL